MPSLPPPPHPLLLSRRLQAYTRHLSTVLEPALARIDKDVDRCVRVHECGCIFSCVRKRVLLAIEA